MKSIMLSVCCLLACAAGAFPINPSFTPEAVAAYKAKADAGDAEAQYLYSSALANGRGVAEDKPQAFAYAKKAVDQGYERALRRVGLGFKEGWGVESNAVKAADCFARFVKWATEAAEQGDANAQCSLGWCYAYGEGVETNKVEAVKWYRKAAENGDADAQCNLGWCYARGEGVKKDMMEAVKWYRKAAEQNNADGWCSLGMCYLLGDGIDENVEEGAKLFRKAAKQGDAFAQNSLGWCYAEGKGVPKDMAEAVAWFRKAAEQGDVRALLNLGWCYAEGEGVGKNAAESDRWYDKASQKAPSDVYRNSRWVILSLMLMFILVIAQSVFCTEYSPSVVLQDMRSKQSPFLSLSPGYPGLVMGIVGAIALLVMSVYLEDPLRNVTRVEFGLVNPLATELLTILRLFVLPGYFVLLVYVSTRRFVKWRRMRRLVTRPNLVYAQYRICAVAGMSGALIFALWFAYISARMERPILVGVSVLVMIVSMICFGPTRKKYAKIINGKMTKYTVIYRESGESKPKQTVLEGYSESSLCRECEEKGLQVLLIRTADEDMVLRKQKSKKAHFTESRGFVLLVVALVVVVLPFGLELIGDAYGLFSFPASRWMKEAFAILTR